MHRRLSSPCSALILGCFVAFAGGACQKEEDPKQEKPADTPGAAQPEPADAAKPASASCTWGIDIDNTELTWTAFKTNDKVPVGGKLTDFKVVGEAKGESPRDLIDGLKFQVNGASVDTALPERDVKINTHFFGNVLDHPNITGTIAATSDDAATVSLTLNRETNEVPFTWSVEDKKLTAKGKIDVLEFKMGGAIDALNAACKELHIGTDGTSKLWSEVELTVTSPLTCN